MKLLPLSCIHTCGMHMYNVSSEYQHLQPFTMISSIFTPKKKSHPFRQRPKILAESPLPAHPRHRQSVTRARILPRGSVPRLPRSVKYRPRRDQQRLIQDSKLLPSKLPPAPGPFPLKGKVGKCQRQHVDITTKDFKDRRDYHVQQRHQEAKQQ